MSSTDNESAVAEVVILDDSVEETSQSASIHNLSAESMTDDVDEETPATEEADNCITVLEDDVDSVEMTPQPKPREKVPDEAQPIFQVAFRDDNSFRCYRSKIELFLTDLLKSRCDKENIKSATEGLVLQIFDFVNTNNYSPQVDESKEYLKEKQSNNCLFTIDTDPKVQDDLDIPMYGKRYKTALEKFKEEFAVVKEDYTPKMTCFNCLGNHSLRDCDQPRNYMAINKNRKEYLNKRGSGSVRYHLDDDQKFGHFVPGQISSSLRKALGIKENELPRHIYKMRMLGYPPGWLEEARLQHSGLNLFNSDGLIEGGSDEEGEIVCPGDKDKYDVKKIIDFPGFNVMPPEGTREDYKQYWGSSMQEHYSKATMLSFLSHKKAEDGYKRKKMPNPANLRVRTDINPGEMEIDEIEDAPVECVPIEGLFVPPLPKVTSDLPPPPPPPPEVEESDNSQSQEDVSVNSNDVSTAPSSRDASPSLTDLENAKKQLLAELDESSSQSNADSAKTVVVPESNSSKSEKPDLNKTDVNNATPKNSPKPSMFGSAHKSIISVHVGTPLLKSTSPFKKLPASEKFSKDICDVINFENLPDSTGKYDQMSELIQKVRMKVSEIQKE